MIIMPNAFLPLTQQWPRIWMMPCISNHLPMDALAHIVDVSYFAYPKTWLHDEAT